MEKIRWGILGCGKIARKFASDLKLVKDAVLVAAGARSMESVKMFAAEFPVQYTHDSYEALAENSEVDVIYIATPHSEHYKNTLLCLQHNKAVLCEKAFAVNKAQVQEMIETAQRKKLFLMEAMWTKFLPHYKKVKALINENRLGEIKSVLINFGFKAVAPVAPRLFEPALAGGSLLDIGIYNVFMATSILGMPEKIEASITPAYSGVDEQCAILLKYSNGAMAQLFSSFATNMATEADICGTEGRMRLLSRFYEPSTTIEYYPGKIDSKQIIPFMKEEGWGYRYEIEHVCHCLQKGFIQSDVMTHDDSLQLISILDEVRRISGIKYPADEL